MFDLLTIGDVVIDTHVVLPEAKIIDGLLAIPYGRKVPIEPSVSMVGGNAANNAVGSSRLGLKVAIYTNVGNKGDEMWDDRIKNKLKKEKVDIRYVVESWDLPSNHNIILNFKGERTILTYHQPWRFHLPELEKTRWVYLTSLSPSYIESDLVEQIIGYLQRIGAKLAYQPGTFQLRQGIKKNARLLSLAEVLVLNLEEAKGLLGYGEGERVEIKKLLKKLQDLGPRRIVVTDGTEGSYGGDEHGFLKLGVFPAELVEMTGAGDAFAAGLVTALIKGKDLSEAMRWGAANSASVVEQVGAQEGLLSYSKMQERLKMNSKIIAKEI